MFEDLIKKEKSVKKERKEAEKIQKRIDEIWKKFWAVDMKKNKKDNRSLDEKSISSSCTS